jgi:hypothetical protein
MAEYRKNAAQEEPISENPGDRGVMPSYMSLGARYGLGNDMMIGNSGKSKQTVNQEYQAYVTAPCSPGDIRPLSFWEVGGDINGTRMLLTRRGRLTGRPFQLFLPWLWIIFRSRPRPFLVSGFSRRVLKRTQSGGIA